MTGVRLTAAQAKAMGIVGGAPATAPSGRRTTRHQLPRQGATSTCQTCGETFTSDAAETRHVADTLHPRYLSAFERVP